MKLLMALGATARACGSRTMRAAAGTAAGRAQVQYVIATASIETGDFEVVGGALSTSARHDEGRARHGAASRSAAAASETALVSAPAVRFHAPCQRAFVSCAI